MPPFSYNKQADMRDQGRADWIKKQDGYYAEHSDAHLRNALKFAKGCGGSEALARREMIIQEMDRRK